MSESTLPGDSGVSLETYKKIPCTVGFTYARVEVDGTVRLCCVSHHAVGNLKDGSFREIWHGRAAQAFRQKLLKIHKKWFHIHDPQWGYCRHCSHIPQNKINSSKLK